MYQNPSMATYLPSTGQYFCQDSNAVWQQTWYNLAESHARKVKLYQDSSCLQLL